MEATERKRRQEFQRKIFLLQAEIHDLIIKVNEIAKSHIDLWLINDELMNGKDAE